MSEEKRIVNRWDELMRSIYKDKEFFLIYSIKKEDWGYNLMVVVPAGKTFDELEKLTDAIKIWFPCNCEMEVRKLTELVNVKLVMQDFSDMTYKPVKCSQFEIFLGYDMYGKAIIVNMNRFPHVLIAGSTGSGKSRLLFIILTNLIYNNNSDIYLTQIRKRDFRKFQSFAKGYADTEETAAYMFNGIVKEINRRVDYLDRNNYENIEECKSMRPIFVTGDEMSFYMEDRTDSPDLAKYKSICLAKIKEIIKTGRSVGVFFIIGIQRTTATELLPIVKSQMRTIITFNQVNKTSSENVIGCADATELQDREFIIMTKRLQRCKTPYIDKNLINEYICLPKDKTLLESSTIAKFVPNNELIKPKTIPKQTRKKGVMEC